MPIPHYLREPCLAIFVSYVGIGIVPLQQDPHDALVSIPCSLGERYLAILICYIRIDVIPFQQDLRDLLIPIPNGPQEQSSAK